MQFEELCTIIAEVLDVEEDTITLETRFIDDLGADSLDLFQIVSEVEDRLGIQVPEDALEEIVTVEDALNAINEVD